MILQEIKRFQKIAGLLHENDNNLDLIKSKALEDIKIQKQKYFDNNDWAGLWNYERIRKAIENTDNIKKINLLVKWYKHEWTDEPLDKIEKM